MPQQINSSSDFYVALESDITGADATNDGSTSGNASTQPNVAVGYYNSTLPTVSDGSGAALQVDSSGRLLVNLSNLNGAATAANQSTLLTRIGTNGDAASVSGSQSAQLRALAESTGLTSATAATSNTGTFSIIAFIKRFLAHAFAAKTRVATSISTSGDNTIIAAPTAGTRIVITKLRIQNATSTATTVLIKDGTTTIERLRTPSDGSGVDCNYGPFDAIYLADNAAFVVNLSGANAHGITVRYYLVTTSTGLPA